LQVCGARAWRKRSDLGAEMQIINPLGQGTASSYTQSRVWRSRRTNRARTWGRASLPNDGVYSGSEVHVCFPHWQLNTRMMRPFAESSIVFTGSSWAPQRLHVRSSIVFLPVKFVVLKWFVVNMTEHRC
jgi:hypothetical protein